MGVSGFLLEAVYNYRKADIVNSGHEYCSSEAIQLRQIPRAVPCRPVAVTSYPHQSDLAGK